MSVPKKILLLGEFSNLHNMLSNSLREFGIETYLVGSPNGFRGLSADLSLSSNFPGLLGRAHTAIKPILNFKKLFGYDVVQAITFEQFHPLVNNNLLRFIAHAAGKFYSLSTGCDSYLNSYLNSVHPYRDICPDCLNFDQHRTDCRLLEANSLKSQQILYHLSEKIIPMQLEYRESILRTEYANKVTAVHRLPFYLESNENIYKKKYHRDLSSIRVAHGLNRYGFKGTKIVEAAKTIMEKRGIRGIDLNILPRMALNNYLSTVKTFDVVIDQLYFESYGYNALYSMSMGLPVISATTDRALKEIGVATSPFISVLPDPEALVELLIKIRDNKRILEFYREVGFDFVKKFHSPDATVPQFLKTWVST